MFRSLKMLNYADVLDIKSTSLSKKLKDESLSLKDLQLLADLTKSNLCLIDRADQSVVLNLSKDA